jgi:hypothetical protein
VTVRPLRLALMLAGLAALPACNVVVTKEPLFTQKDAAGAPPLRPGVWMFFKDPDCKVDEAQPFVDWPSCAGGGLVGDSEVSGRKSPDGPRDELETTPYVLAAGDPRIMQLQVDLDLSASASTTASGGAEASASAPQSAHARPYAYAGVAPTRFDDRGRITAFTLWPVQCGPPPPKNAKGEDVAAATLKPLPGMIMKKDDVVCTTGSQAALRNAARLSRGWTDEPRQARWLRDGPR